MQIVGGKRNENHIFPTTVNINYFKIFLSFLQPSTRKGIWCLASSRLYGCSAISLFCFCLCYCCAIDDIPHFLCSLPCNEIPCHTIPYFPAAAISEHVSHVYHLNCQRYLKCSIWCKFESIGGTHFTILCKLIQHICMITFNRKVFKLDWIQFYLISFYSNEKSFRIIFFN